MNEIKFPSGISEIKIPALTQWDKNQRLVISGIDTAGSVFQVHFANVDSKQAIVRMAYQNGSVHEVDIPNKLLQERHTIYAYVYLTEYVIASEVDSTTEGDYYTKSSGVYTKVTLPREYKAGVTYYKQTGATVKTIIIPVIPRKKPDGYIDAGDPSEEELLEELLRYCNNLGYRLDVYTNLVNEYRSKDLVQLVTKAEYDALVAAGTLETGVIYVIKEEDTIALIAEDVRQFVSDGINAGEIAVGTTEYSMSLYERELGASESNPIDINDITTKGRWYIENSSISIPYVSNLPEQVCGKLIVTDCIRDFLDTREQWKTLRQEYITCNGHYYRCNIVDENGYHSGWDKWKKLAIIDKDENASYPDHAKNADRADRARVVQGIEKFPNSVYDLTCPITERGIYVAIIKNTFSNGDVSWATAIIYVFDLSVDIEASGSNYLKYNAEKGALEISYNGSTETPYKLWKVVKIGEC